MDDMPDTKLQVMGLKNTGYTTVGHGLRQVSKFATDNIYRQKSTCLNERII